MEGRTEKFSLGGTWFWWEARIFLQILGIMFVAWAIAGLQLDDLLVGLAGLGLFSVFWLPPSLLAVRFGNRVEFTPTDLRIRQGFRTRHIPLTAIKEVKMRQRHSRWSWVLLFGEKVPLGRHVDIHFDMAAVRPQHQIDSISWPPGVKGLRRKLITPPDGVIHLSPRDERRFASELEARVRVAREEVDTP